MNFKLDVEQGGLGTPQGSLGRTRAVQGSLGWSRRPDQNQFKVDFEVLVTINKLQSTQTFQSLPSLPQSTLVRPRLLQAALGNPWPTQSTLVRPRLLQAALGHPWPTQSTLVHPSPPRPSKASLVCPSPPQSSLVHSQSTLVHPIPHLT